MSAPTDTRAVTIDDLMAAEFALRMARREEALATKELDELGARANVLLLRRREAKSMCMTAAVLVEGLTARLIREGVL